MNRPIVISLYSPPDSAKSPPKSHATTIEELLASLCEQPVEVANKGDAPAWSPIEYSGTSRKAKEALGAWALVYDIDDPDTDYEALIDKLDKTQWVYVLHDTYTDFCARLVIPLASRVTPEDYAGLRERIAHDLELTHDPACSDLARLFYTPSCAPGAERGPATRGGSIVLEPARKNDTGFDLGPLREDIKNYRGKAEYREQLAQLLDGTLVIPKSQREAILHPLMGVLAFLRNAPKEPMLEELLRVVLCNREGADTMLSEWTHKAMYSFRRGMELKAKEDGAKAKFEAALRPSTEADAWKSALKFNADKSGAVKGLKALECNVMTVLENDPAFKGHVRWNLLRNKIEITGGILKKEPTESLAVPTAAWFQKSSYNCDINASLAGTCVQHVAVHNGYDPVREYLEAIPKWDGVKRAGNLLIDYAHALDSSWTQLVTKKFFIACIARAMKPGCQVDNVLLLHGAQGGGKTSFVRVMGAGFHVETSLDLRSKDAVMVSASAWLVELGELASMRNLDIESVRNFLTRKEDSIRLPYGRAVVQMPRRCVFVGTTNNAQPLSDPDGNRRMWPVSVGMFDTTGLEKVRDQVWAEALAYFNEGQQWWLTDDEAVRAKAEASIFESEDLVESEIRTWFGGLPASAWPKEITLSDVITKIQLKSPSDVKPHEKSEISRALLRMFKRSRKLTQFGFSWFYVVPPRDEMMTANE